MSGDARRIGTGSGGLTRTFQDLQPRRCELRERFADPVVARKRHQASLSPDVSQIETLRCLIRTWGRWASDIGAAKIEPLVDGPRSAHTDPPEPEEESQLIFITAKFDVRPESVEDWPAIAGSFTEATRAEPGCLWFDWSRSLEAPHEFVLVEAFADDAAATHHVGSDHFRAAQRDLPPHLVSTPRIINATIPGTDWSELGELAVEG